MEASTKFNFGILMSYFGGIIILALVILVNLPACIGIIIYTVVGGIGILMTRNAHNAVLLSVLEKLTVIEKLTAKVKKVEKN